MFGFSLLASGYWVASLFINFNQSGIVSVITELLWIPLLGLLFFISLLSLGMWIKEKFSSKLRERMRGSGEPAVP